MECKSFRVYLKHVTNHVYVLFQFTWLAPLSTANLVQKIYVGSYLKGSINQAIPWINNNLSNLQNVLLFFTRDIFNKCLKQNLVNGFGFNSPFKESESNKGYCLFHCLGKNFKLKTM